MASDQESATASQGAARHAFEQRARSEQSAQARLLHAIYPADSSTLDCNDRASWSGLAGVTSSVDAVVAGDWNRVHRRAHRQRLAMRIEALLQQTLGDRFVVGRRLHGS